MSRYLSITSTQRPFPLEVDDNNRVVWAVNFEGVAAAAVDKWEEELAQKIVDAGLGTLNTDLFLSPKKPIPTGDGPYTFLIDTGGTAPDETHDGARYERLSVQVTVRAKSYATGRTRILAIWRELDSTYNTTITAA